MSATTSRGVIATVFIRLVLPAGVMVLGLIAAMVGIISAHAGLSTRAALILGGAIGFAVGALEIWWRIRAKFSPDPAIRSRSAIRADIAMGAIFVAIGLFGVNAFAREERLDFGPERQLSGKLANLDLDMSVRGNGSASLMLVGASSPLHWRCGFDCSRWADLKGLSQTPGVSLHVTALKDRFIGLAADGREILAPKPERQRLQLNDGLVLFSMALLTIVSTGYIVRRAQALGALYQAPDGSGVGRYRALLRGDLSGSRKGRI